MPAVGGSILGCTLDGRYFPVAADADADRDIGGFANTVEPNGDGSARLVKKRKPWKVGGLTLEINEQRDDAKFLQDLADRKEFWPLTVDLASGDTYAGEGQITNDLASQTMSATADVEFSGDRKSVV